MFKQKKGCIIFNYSKWSWLRKITCFISVGILVGQLILFLNYGQNLTTIQTTAILPVLGVTVTKPKCGLVAFFSQIVSISLISSLVHEISLVESGFFTYMGTGFIILVLVWQLMKRQQENQRLITKLQDQKQSIENLLNFLPICVHCQNIKNKDGTWEDFQTFLRESVPVNFSHGVCDECTKKYYNKYLSNK